MTGVTLICFFLNPYPYPRTLYPCSNRCGVTVGLGGFTMGLSGFNMVFYSFIIIIYIIKLQNPLPAFAAREGVVVVVVVAKKREAPPACVCSKGGGHCHCHCCPEQKHPPARSEGGLSLSLLLP